jgi:hypothetical protein
MHGELSNTIPVFLVIVICLFVYSNSLWREYLQAGLVNNV